MANLLRKSARVLMQSDGGALAMLYGRVWRGVRGHDS